MNIKQESLDHYDRMIACAKTLPASDKPDNATMWVLIGEGWESRSCAYCRKYQSDCSSCKLNTALGCCNDLWRAMRDSLTWGEWIAYAEATRKYIKENG